MTRKSPHVTGVRSLTANQVVAINVDTARRRKGWTQLKAVKELARYGLQWTRANYAMSIQTTARGRRIREFSADELLVFAQCFEVAIWEMFIVPRNAVVALPGGAPKLPPSMVRYYAYSIGRRLMGGSRRSRS